MYATGARHAISACPREASKARAVSACALRRLFSTRDSGRRQSAAAIRVEEALYLFEYRHALTLVHRRDKLRAEEDPAGPADGRKVQKAKMAIE